MIFLDMVSTFLTVITLLISIFLLYYKRCFTYWTKKNIPGPKPSIPFGNAQNIFTRNVTEFEHIKQIYDQMKIRNEKHCGIYTFTSPAYMPLDPEYIKNITCKDFNHFVNRGMYHDEDNDPLSAHLLSLEDEKWKNLRAKFTPIFTSGKMKTMFNSLVICSNQMLEAMEELAVNPLDIREICACYTTDVIGTCAFGLDCNSFQEEAEFRKYGKKAMHPSVQNILRIVFCSSFSRLAKFFKIRLMNAEVSKFFIDAIRSTLKYREENEIIRNDFLEISLRLKQNNELTVEEIAAQAFIFFLAGFETSSTTMSCCIYELARNESIQEKLRGEIRNVLTKYDDKITYESIFEIKYLEQVIEETLRIYPPIPQIQRVCTKDYKLPEHDVVLKKGTRIILPVFALHRDLEYYPEPEKFDPQRFNDENKSNRHPFSYLPFGEGPRICIGKRFGLMQVKVGLIALLLNYKLRLNKNTKTPICFDRNGFLLTVKDTIWLDAIKLNK